MPAVLGPAVWGRRERQGFAPVLEEVLREQDPGLSWEIDWELERFERDPSPPAWQILRKVRRIDD